MQRSYIKLSFILMPTKTLATSQADGVLRPLLALIPNIPFSLGTLPVFLCPPVSYFMPR